MGVRKWTSMTVSHADGSRGHASGEIDTTGLTDQEAVGEVVDHIRRTASAQGHVVSPYDIQIHH